MERWQGLRAHSPYQAPEAEVLVIRFEERFLAYNNDNNEVLNRGSDEDFD